MENFTIHIFGYGETQINSKELSVKVATDTLTTVNPLIEAIYAKKPADNPVEITDYHAINLFGYNDVRWQVQDNSFEVKDDADLVPLIDALIVELQVAKDSESVVAPQV